MAVKAKIKAISIGTITTIIEVVSSIFDALQNWGDVWRDFWLKRKQKKLLKEAEKALKNHDIDKINEINNR
jgi:hypothetical protein